MLTGCGSEQNLNKCFVDKDLIMDLFEYMRENNKNNESPLAMRLRPENSGGDGWTVAHSR